MMNGRFFSGTRVEAYIADGRERFKKTNEKKAGIIESLDDDGAGWEAKPTREDDEAQRLDKFGSWLEGGPPEGESKA